MYVAIIPDFFELYIILARIFDGISYLKYGIKYLFYHILLKNKNIKLYKADQKMRQVIIFFI